MKKFDFTKMKDGWFIGDFEPSAFRTKIFEVAYVEHTKSEKRQKHYHNFVTEIALVLKGKMLINGIIFSQGDILVTNPKEILETIFLEKTQILGIKTPSNVNDKILLD